ncbi:MAG: hypothetical protein HY681_01040 [Chloroflexi bacterium]|nr:hypothetical protein [Chloroflexota bacterium]
MRDESRPAYYALSAGGWRDYVTLLHTPYTLWHLSYVVLGAAAAPVLHLDRLAWTVLAFFLAVGLAAHALDELQGRPLKTGIPSGMLRGIGGLALAGAVGVGVYASIRISLWGVPFIAFGAFMVLAYNLELWGGLFHTDLWFALAWGAFPALAGYWANAEAIRPAALIVAAACLALTLAQRTLSAQCRSLRRKVTHLSGSVEYQNGRREELTVAALLQVPERALRYLSYTVPLLALGWLVARWAY